MSQSAMGCGSSLLWVRLRLTDVDAFTSLLRLDFFGVSNLKDHLHSFV